MSTAYILTPELRRKLKEPLGTLIRGSFDETMKRFRDMTENEKPASIISVGDTVSKNIVNNNIFPRLSIIDNRVMRKSVQSTQLLAERSIHVKNPPGTITAEALAAIRDALKGNCRVKIVVDGEEDLLALIAILYAQEKSFVIYGQPREGIVVVKVTPEKKAEVAAILNAMESARKAK
ncbi:MAG: DUF359 domain-containing protein [Candidatus Bathyarchaeota archaeon]|nr:DUF359 domain-containing protein [Candidatus Bathyarchaeota archaeon]MDH5788194.1 DUF359 domain-containing protein [Candidatus Bathyarchaeota archaeon]